jgi:hypothetical protein
MRKTARSGLMLVLCCGLAFQSMVAGSHGLAQKSPKRISVSGRFLARVPIAAVTTVGMNYESFVFEVEPREKELGSQLIKLSYRFMQQDPQIPKAFLDYALVHRFTMVRDESCDETWGAMSTNYVFDTSGGFRGSKNALVYTSNAPTPQIDRQTVLNCYTVTPQDYKSTTKGHAGDSASVGK